MEGLVFLVIHVVVGTVPAPGNEKPDVSNKWQKAIDEFDIRDRMAPPPAQPIVFTGSSTIRLWNLTKSFPGMPVVNCGFGGSQYSDVLFHVHQFVVRYRPARIVLYSGDNDIAAGKSAESVSGDVRAVVEAIRRDLPKVPLILIGVKPSIARWNLYPEMKRTNKLIEGCAKTAANIRFVDPAPLLLTPGGKPDPQYFMKDGLHLNDAGYTRLAALIKPLL